MLPLSTLYRKVTSVSDLLFSSDMRFNWIDFVGAAFCLAALKWKSYLPHIKNNQLRWTSTGKQRNWALDLITILTLILVYGITRVGERINRVLFTFKSANHIRGGFLRERVIHCRTVLKSRMSSREVGGTPHCFPLDPLLPMIHLNSHPCLR